MLLARPIIACIVLAACAAAHGQTMPVPMKGIDYGPGRVGAIEAINYADKRISACGRVGSIVSAPRALFIADVLRVDIRHYRE